jgi:hypothetical protein
MFKIRLSHHRVLSFTVLVKSQNYKYGTKRSAEVAFKLNLSFIVPNQVNEFQWERKTHVSGAIHYT